MVLGLSFEHPDVIPVMGHLYVKTPEALQLLLDALKEIGYEVKNNRDDGQYRERGVSAEHMEREGWSLWFAKLPDIHFGKCHSCDSRISSRGIKAHGHTCEVCGEVTYYELVDGSTVTFEFVSSEQELFPPTVTMKVKRWDGEYLYLYPQPEEGRRIGSLDHKGTFEYFAKHQGKWESVEEDGIELIRIRYIESFYRQPDAVIEMLDSSGRYYNHHIIKVWEDKEYKEYDHSFPVPEMINIYESWHWAPLPASPTLHARILSAAGQVSDKGYYHQDGRAAFNHRHWEEMARFVRHFTHLDADAFDQAWPRFRMSGPGGIDDLARFCHPMAQIENRPNIWNSVATVGKALSGQPITDDEVQAALEGLSDPANPFRS